MADDETDLENLPIDMKVDDTILKLAEQYVGYENRAKAINKDKAAVREQADKIGIPSLAWQIGVRMVKMMDTRERRDFERGFKRVTGVLSKNADTLFPEDIERQKKRAAKKAADLAKAGKETPEQQERRVAADANPRSDPKRGGAGKAKKPSTAAEIAEETSRKREQQQALIEENGAKATLGKPWPDDVAAAEQAEGEAVLDALTPRTKKAQSEIAAEKREAAKLN